jgi:hypothetical protein
LLKKKRLVVVSILVVVLLSFTSLAMAQSNVDQFNLHLGGDSVAVSAVMDTTDFQSVLLGLGSFDGDTEIMLGKQWQGIELSKNNEIQDNLTYNAGVALGEDFDIFCGVGYKLNKDFNIGLNLHTNSGLMATLSLKSF